MLILKTVHTYREFSMKSYTFIKDEIRSKDNFDMATVTVMGPRTINFSIADCFVHVNLQEKKQKQVFYLSFGKCPKISYTKMSEKMACANNAEPDQTAPEEAVWSGSTLFAIPVWLGSSLFAIPQSIETTA